MPKLLLAHWPFAQADSQTQITKELPKPTHKDRQLWADQHEKKTPYYHIDGLVCYKWRGSPLIQLWAERKSHTAISRIFGMVILRVKGSNIDSQPIYLGQTLERNACKPYYTLGHCPSYPSGSNQCIGLTLCCKSQKPKYHFIFSIFFNIFAPRDCKGFFTVCY